MIGVRRFGSGPPLVALHGFTLTGQQFAPSGALLGRTVIAPDLPGHGRSVDASTDIIDVIDMVASTVESAGVPVPVVGYSQGGRLALLTSLERPDAFSALVLISANAGIENQDRRASRARADAATAERLATMTIDEFLDVWTSVGITSTEHLTVDVRDADRAVRLENSPLGLASALTGYGQGAQNSVWNKLSDLKMPVLVMSGGRDDTYTLIADRMAELIPNAERVTIGGAGHNPLLEAPDVAYGSISAFLDRLG
jgi:2-succinyl-6-hydroxy-2,4-cyclohexadiene-1-carboxylate synthase